MCLANTLDAHYCKLFFAVFREIAVNEKVDLLKPIRVCSA